MKLSTRNQLAGTVTDVTAGEAMAVVKVRLTGGESVTSSITREAVEELGLAEGSQVVVLIKSTEVALAVEDRAVEDRAVEDRAVEDRAVEDRAVED